MGCDAQREIAGRRGPLLPKQSREEGVVPHSTVTSGFAAARTSRRASRSGGGMRRGTATVRVVAAGHTGARGL